MKEYKEVYPNEYKELKRALDNDYHVELKDLPSYEIGASIATRNASGETQNVLSKRFTSIIGGSADLTGSTKAKGLDGDFSKENRLGRNINYGVREHAMGSISNGITLHGGLKSFAGGFFVFSDYMKPPLRMAALMNIPSIFVFSHDSLFVGEDGPTHQPVEQLVMLRSIPNFTTIRPADANETVQAWKFAINNEGPTAIITTRQNVTNYSNFNENFDKGAYVISEAKGDLDGILLASGSEVSLAVEAQKELEKECIYVKVVSMPSMETFDAQDSSYKQEVLNSDKILAIEMASPMPWYKYTKHVFGVETFGLSAPMQTVKETFKFTKEHIVKLYKKI